MKVGDTITWPGAARPNDYLYKIVEMDSVSVLLQWTDNKGAEQEYRYRLNELESLLTGGSCILQSCDSSSSEEDSEEPLTRLELIFGSN